jgi:hypothetical protein
MHLHTFCLSQGISQFKERDVRVLHHQFFKEGPMWGKFASITGATLRCGRRVSPRFDAPRPASWEYPKLCV